MTSADKPGHIAQCLELGILFEVSANKPGNITMVMGFEDTFYQHFLASAVAAVPSFRYAARQGMKVAEGQIGVGEVGLGRIIKGCVEDIDSWQTGGNTLLGAVILLSPMAVAAGMTPAEHKYHFKPDKIRKNLSRVVEATTPQDAVEVYQAIDIANPSGLDKAPKLDVNDPDSQGRLLEEGVSLYETFQIAAEYDSVCAEWVENYPLTFDVAYPYLDAQIKEGCNLNKAVIHAFLKVLGRYPDTLIARKAGMQKAKEVSSMAQEVLDLGGLETSQGRRRLDVFDRWLRKQGNLLNPGTTADITSAALAVMVLEGYRP